VEDKKPIREFRIKGGNIILDYIKKFSITEKTIFGVFCIALIISALSILFKLSNSFMVQSPTYGGQFTEGIIGLPRTINPVLAITDIDKDITSIVFSGLMKYTDGNLTKDIAKSYTISDDGLTYDFILRDNVYFQDGIRLTAEDIAFTIQKIQNPNIKSPKRSDWLNISTKVVSENEIQFVLKQPYSPFLLNTTLGILPKHVWNNIPDEQFIFSENNVKAIGSGPYKITSIKKDSSGIPTSYKLDTWSKYYDKSPFISTINLNFYTDYSKAISALNSKTIDMLGSVTPEDANKISKNNSFKILSIPYSRTFGLFLNQNQSSALADIAVRQALNVAVDRQSIVNNVFGQHGLPLYGPIPFSNAKSDLFDDNGMNSTSTADLPANILKAQKILEKNGWKKNTSGIYEKKTSKNTTQTLSFNLYTANSDDLKKVADMVKTSWSALGIDINIKVFEPSDLFQNVIRQRKYDILLFGEMIGKDKDYYAFWHSSQRNAPGLNVSMYVNSKVDKILEDLRTTQNDSDKEKLMNNFNQIIEDEIPEIFLYTPNYIYIINSDIKNINTRAITASSDRWNTISNWYIKTENVWKFFKNNK
jgi:peptide/nickel transport system substrate-binding protein